MDGPVIPAVTDLPEDQDDREDHQKMYHCKEYLGDIAYHDVQREEKDKYQGGEGEIERHP
ncbi:MAG: hypothetical protein HBSAPP04_12150 [Ignavibacteriaceae bacterium]|nr:MAG: hypothetical protein HBSAPP04_12150 [Ignavibacteriaceae bacterium]